MESLPQKNVDAIESFEKPAPVLFVTSNQGHNDNLCLFTLQQFRNIPSALVNQSPPLCERQPI
jgi:hypothetical protein